MTRETTKKPLVDVLCLCGRPHPCPLHGREEDWQPRLFDPDKLRSSRTP